MKSIVDSFNTKDDVSLGKFLKEVENNTPLSVEILKESYIRKGKAHIIGITGPPGAGKSTLVSKMCKVLAKQGLSIGIVCVDPTSPFTQGALLGDRIRMQELSKLPNVFTKSLATRGNLGGLAASTADIVNVIDAYEKDVILVETVGVGQVEFEIMKVADTVALVNVPGLGDSLQTLKGGIMEIADLYVINQADRPGANESVRDLKMMVRELGKTDWQRPVLKTIATSEEGIEELIEKIHEHREYLQNSELWKNKREDRNITILKNIVLGLLSDEAREMIQSNKELQAKIEEVKYGRLDPITVSHEIVNNLVSK
ncbi:methylmalonyl Co-A mutase-associated GTPase MeaB [Bacillus sp. JJ1533]|uniref:methylmalonyl Co-A mutase-associated GTPase MeaB n=1 Tax=Bacillus sp. JJ1533 TaxID=3122959 RepID=UPI002FFDC1AF